MKILWLSDSPNLLTGYGIASDKIVKGLIGLGHEVNVIGWNNTGEQKFNGYTIYPRGKDFHCKDVLVDYIKRFKPDVLITLCDLSFISYFLEESFRKSLWKIVKWIPYYPIDGVPMPLFHRELLKRAYKVVAMSKFGADAVKEYASLNSEVIYLGVDNIFKPMDKEKIKKEFGLEGKFVVGFVGRNQLRKMIPELIRAFKIFSRDKEDAILYLHTEPVSKSGWNLLEFVKLHGLSGKIIFSNKASLGIGFEEKEMARLYNLFDIHASSTSGEGFNLPALESQACGIPNVLTDYTTSKELVEGRGELARVKTFITDNLNSEKAIVDVEDFAKRLELLYKNEKLRMEYSRRAVEFAGEFSWNKIIKKWDYFLKRL
ncbi:MAG: glycosyltransferase family 4 protein [Nanoarchaeota archaeon]